jgi:hypothetical protein
MHERRSVELVLALAAAVFITVAYVFVQVILQDIPAAGSFYGHSMGIFGFLLMLMTETLYSLRKRSRNAAWGKMARWLEFHIFTGIVGPYMVLLHSSWKFNGLAGALMLLTVLIVVSGFIGRYIYTAIPRAPEGAERSLEELEGEMLRIEEDMKRIAVDAMAPARLLQPATEQSLQPAVALPVEAANNRNGSSANQAEDGIAAAAQQRYYDRLQRDHETLRRQTSRLAAARRMMALWHAVHIPLGLTLFIMAFIHIGAAIYYGLLL